MTGRLWMENRASNRWRAGVSGVVSSGLVWFLVESGFRQGGVVVAVGLALSVGWILFDGAYSIYLLFWYTSEPASLPGAPGNREAGEDGITEFEAAEYRKFALDFAWLVTIGAIFWIGGAVALSEGQ